MVLKPSTTLQEIFENEIELPDFGPERNLIFSALDKCRWIMERETKKEDIYFRYEDEDSEERQWLDSHPEKLDTLIDKWWECLDRNDYYWESYWSDLDYSIHKLMEEKHP